MKRIPSASCGLFYLVLLDYGQLDWLTVASAC